MINNPKSTSEHLKNFVFETRAIIDLANQEDIDFARGSDENLEVPIYRYLNKIGKPVPYEDYLVIIKDLDAFFEEVHKEKLKWKVPRPFKVAEMYGIPFKRPYISQTAQSFSYPSGHSAGSRYLVHLLVNKYKKEFTEEEKYNLYSIANRIAWGRIQIGVHTTQDIKEGKRFADLYFLKKRK